MINQIYPWQTQQWQQLMSQRAQQRLPHALLFVGAEGVGKKDCALKLAHVLLCNKSDEPCGQCHACYLIQAHSHPDLLLIEPEQAGQMIKIDQIRAMVQFVNETAQQGGLRVIIINPATAMNINAANALLKTLEEPAPNILIILISDQSLRLPATIKSRCQKIIFSKPSRHIVLEWLQAELKESELNLQLLLNLADNSPLKVIELAKKENAAYLILRQELYQGLDLLTKNQADPLQLATQLQEQDIKIILNLLLVWLQDLLRYQLSEGTAALINIDYKIMFAKQAQIFSSQILFKFLDEVKKRYAIVTASLNLNRQLVLEELLIRWVHYASC